MSYFKCYSKCNQRVLNSEAYENCTSICSDTYSKSLVAPMIWIGFYIAGASLVCMLAMGTDLVNGLRMKKSWFPCKYFTLNAAISAVLAVALKMPVDLTTIMPCGKDQLMKLSATALMSVSMGNFMPSLAAMSDPELVANLMALAVFIVPLISNICIQIKTGLIYKGVVPQHIIVIFCIGFQFALLVSTAIACPAMKQLLQEAYNKEAKSTLIIGKESTTEAKTTSSEDTNYEEMNLSPELKKHWIMAQTSSPQFVIARSVICTASGAICVLTVLVLAEAVIQLYITMSKDYIFFSPSSDYKWSANVIVLVQAAAVIVGSISPISRWFTVVWFNFEESTKSPCKDLWRVEPYWTQRLTELNSHKFIGKGKHMALNFLIKFQKFTVLSCKFLRLVSLVYLLPFMFVYKIKIFCLTLRREKKRKLYKCEPSWVLKLENETDLPKSTIEKIISVGYRYFNKRTKKKLPVSRNQIKKLFKKTITVFHSHFKKGNQTNEKSSGGGFFDNGIKEFDWDVLIKDLRTKINDIDGVVSSKNPIPCWAIMIVTLSTIVCAIKTTWDKEFVSTVKDILPHVIYVENAINGTATSQTKIHDHAMNMWTDVLKYKKWLNTELPIKINNSNFDHREHFKTILETLKKDLSDTVACTRWMNETVDIIIKFLDTKLDIEDQQQLHHQKLDIDDQEQQQLHDQMITRMVLDIIVTCLVNLTGDITANISNASIEKRELVIKMAVSISAKAVKIQKIAKESSYK